jgi:hypothetical protein
MSKSKKAIALSVVVAAALVLTPGGCSPEQQQQADQAAADANTAGQALKDLAESPAGSLIPPQVRIIMELLGIGAMAAFGVWQKIRGAQAQGTSDKLSVTLRAVADAIDQSAPTAANVVKGNVKRVMDDRQIRRMADPIVNAHRSKLTT